MALNIDTYFRAMSNNTPETMTMSIDWYKTLSDEEMKNKKKWYGRFQYKNMFKEKETNKIFSKKYRQICLKKTNKQGMKTWNNTERINITIPRKN